MILVWPFCRAVINLSHVLCRMAPLAYHSLLLAPCSAVYMLLLINRIIMRTKIHKKSKIQTITVHYLNVGRGMLTHEIVLNEAYQNTIDVVLIQESFFFGITLDVSQKAIPLMILSHLTTIGSQYNHMSSHMFARN